MKCERCPFTLPCYMKKLFETSAVCSCLKCGRFVVRFDDTPACYRKFVPLRDDHASQTIIRSYSSGEYYRVGVIPQEPIVAAIVTLPIRTQFCFHCDSLIRRFDVVQFCVCALDGYGLFGGMYTIDLDARIQQMRDEGEL